MSNQEKTCKCKDLSNGDIINLDRNQRCIVCGRDWSCDIPTPNNQEKKKHVCPPDGCKFYGPKWTGAEQATNAIYIGISTPNTVIQEIKERFEHLMLDGDKVQKGQMLSSEAILEYLQSEIPIYISQGRRTALQEVEKGVEKLDTYCRHKNTLYPEGNERFQMDDMVLLPDVESLINNLTQK